MPGLSMDPLSAGASVMSSAMSMLEGAANRRFQKEENQKNRDFNASESQKSRAYNSRMVAQQNEFNSPQAMMRRLNDAGINPAMAYSQGVGSLGSIGTGSTSQQASYSGGVTPVMSDMSGIQQAGLVAAQTDLIKAQTKKTLNEAGNVGIQNEFLPQLLQGQININGRSVRVLDSTEAKNWSTVDNIDKNTSLINDISAKYVAEKDAILASIDGIKSESFEKQMSALFSYPRNAALVGQLIKSIEAFDSNIRLNNAQAQQLIALTPALVALYESQVDLNTANKDYVQTQDTIARDRHYPFQVALRSIPLGQLQPEVCTAYLEYLKSFGINNSVAVAGVNIADFNSKVNLLSEIFQLASNIGFMATGNPALFGLSVGGQLAGSKPSNAALVGRDAWTRSHPGQTPPTLRSGKYR